MGIYLVIPHQIWPELPTVQFGLSVQKVKGHWTFHSLQNAFWNYFLLISLNMYWTILFGPFQVPLQNTPKKILNVLWVLWLYVELWHGCWCNFASWFWSNSWGCKMHVYVHICSTLIWYASIDYHVGSVDDMSYSQKMGNTTHKDVHFFVSHWKVVHVIPYSAVLFLSYEAYEVYCENCCWWFIAMFS
jgi:hypothetical protein